MRNIFFIILLIQQVAFQATVAYLDYADCHTKYRNIRNRDATILQTHNGKIIGKCSTVTINNPTTTAGTAGTASKQDILTWFAVPYAQAPIGTLRFRPPVPVNNWNNIKDGTRYPPACIQFTPDYPVLDETYPKMQQQTSEDCLYLNMYVPAEPYVNSVMLKKNGVGSQLLPILVFIHGGSFLEGSSVEDNYDGSTLAAHGSIIVITINYRLGGLGFLYVANSNITGNQGFLDQTMALKWIHENARMFGGDPDRITISGESAGSKSVGYHLLYNRSWPYFRSAILQSGNPLITNSAILNASDATQRAKAILSLAGCGDSADQKDDNDESIVECAINLNVDMFRDAYNNYFYNVIAESNPFIFFSIITPTTLVLDGETFNEQPIETLRKGNVKKCNILAGMTKNEGGLFMALAGPFGTSPAEWQLKNLTYVNKTSFYTYLNQMLTYYPYYPKKLANIDFINNIIGMYVNRTTTTREADEINYFSALSDVITENLFVCPTYEWLAYYAATSSNNDVYLYSYNHRISSTIYPPQYGVVHGDELAMVFGETLANKRFPLLSENNWNAVFHSYSTAERRFNIEFLKYWCSFVKYGNPNHYDSSNSNYATKVKWPTFQIGQSLIKNRSNTWTNFDAFGVSSPYLAFNQNSFQADIYDIKKLNCPIWKNY